MPTETMHREVEKKENYFAVQVIAGEECAIVINGVIQTQLVIPYDGKLRCYMARDKANIVYK